MFQIFNGTTRGLGETPQLDTYLKMGVGFRKYLHHLKGANLAVFLCIVLHADERGWSTPSMNQLKDETGYQLGTVSAAVTSLCETIIEGKRLMFAMQERKRGRFKQNAYLIFPSPEEIALHTDAERKPRRDDPPHTIEPYTEKPYTEDRTNGIKHSLEDNTENTLPMIVLKGDRVHARTREDSPSPLKDTGNTPIKSFKKAAQPYQDKKNAPLQSSGKVSPPQSDAEISMIDALATACVKDTKLKQHYRQLQDTARQVISAGYVAADVTRWRTECWPKHWKTKNQDIPTLKDVLDEIATVRALPVNVIANGGSKYLNDPYFADDDLDDLPIVAAVDELPPRQIELHKETDSKLKGWFATKGQLEVQLNRATYDTWIRPMVAIGYADPDTLVLEASNSYVADWFHRHIEASVLETYNRIDQRCGKHKKPSIAFSVVVKGDMQYRAVTS